MTLLPVLLVNPDTGHVFAHANVTLLQVVLSLQAYDRGDTGVCYAVLHPNLDVDLSIDQVSIVRCLLVEPLEHLDNRP